MLRIPLFTSISLVGADFAHFSLKNNGVGYFKGKNHPWDASFACEVAHIRDETVERLVNFSQDHNLRRPKLMGFSVYKKSHLGKLKRVPFNFNLRMLRDFVWWKLGRPENCH